MKHYVKISNEDFALMKHYIETYKDIEDYGDADEDFYAYFAVIDDKMLDLDQQINELSVYGILKRRDKDGIPAMILFRVMNCEKCRRSRYCEDKKYYPTRPTYRDLVENKVSLTDLIHEMCWDGWTKDWEIYERPNLRFSINITVMMEEGMVD